MAAAEMHTAAAEHAASADVEIFIDDDDRGPVIARCDRRGQPGNAGADHHHVDREVPIDRRLRIRVLCADTSERRGADANRTF